MSLPGKDGSSLLDRVRPHLGWLHLDANRTARLESIVGTLDNDLFPGGIIPRLIDKEMRYCAVAATHAQRQRLSSLLRASVGPTITDFSGRSVPLQAGDALEELLLENGYGQCLHFSAGEETNRGQYASAALVRLHSLVDEASSFSANQPGTTAQELRRFEHALAAYDRRSAEEAIRFLQINMRLDAVNLGALTVRLHSRFQEWDQICQLGIFPSLCKARRTAKITDLLAESVYQTYLLALENEEDPSPLISAFNETVRPITGNLFGSCPEYLSPLAGKAFLLAAAGSDPRDDNLAERLRTISDHWPDDEREAFVVLSDRLFPIDVVLDDEPATAESDFQRQIEALRSHEELATLARAQAGLIAATQLNTIQAFRILVAYVERLEPPDKDLLLSNPFSRRAYQSMVEQSEGIFVPENWVEWIEALDKSDLSVPNDMAANSLGQWKVNEHLRDDERVSQLVDAIHNGSSTAEDRLLDVLPLMVQWLQSDVAWPNPLLAPLYRTIYDRILLHLSLRWWREAGGVARELLQAMLELGPEPNDYALLLDDMADVLPSVPGRADVELLVELVEIIVDNDSPDPESRTRLWVKIVEGLRSVQFLLSVEQRALINDMGPVFGVDEVFPVSPETHDEIADGNELADKTVAIYTLNGPVARRTGRLLEVLYPGVRVDIANDTVASQGLQELARRADVFVVCWRSATHAATEFIKRHRPGHALTLYAAGTGSSSILRSLQDAYAS